MKFTKLQKYLTTKIWSYTVVTYTTYRPYFMKKTLVYLRCDSCHVDGQISITSNPVEDQRRVGLANQYLSYPAYVALQ